VQVALQVVSVEDGLELTEKFERVLDVRDNFEVGVDVLLQRGLNRGDVHIKLDEITVECVIVEIEELVVLLFEGVHEGLEGDNNRLDVLQVVLLEGLELLDGREKFLQLGDSAAEQVELAENLGGVEVELLGLGTP